MLISMAVYNTCSFAFLIASTSLCITKPLTLTRYSNSCTSGSPSCYRSNCNICLAIRGYNIWPESLGNSPKLFR
ncbi:hypothetical protein BJ878DRAFT_525644 [Calycina marina]|uniref:Secreted protein n=1 Tax=Calycina marina TaxID=1763456 RepID=A0A9P7YVJ2_9HELO|nr:hypothetical protein BJ878DRAFT_525644 [Calycina marina]